MSRRWNAAHSWSKSAQELFSHVQGDSELFSTERKAYKDALSAHVVLRLAKKADSTLGDDRSLMNEAFVEGFSLDDLRRMKLMREAAEKGGINFLEGEDDSEDPTADTIMPEMTFVPKDVTKPRSEKRK